MTPRPLHLLKGLNDDQLEAALCDTHCLCSACPGSGKSKTAAQKAAFLLSGNPKVLLGAVTFTKEAATELRDRIIDAAGEQYASRLLVGTFHSLCLIQQSPDRKLQYGGDILSILQRQAGNATRRKLSTSNIAMEGERIAFVVRAIEECGNDMDVDQATSIIEAAKASLAIGHAVDNPDAKALHDIYQAILARNHKIDFQDIIARTVSGMRAGTIAPFPFTHLLIDEFQDTDALQFAWAMLHKDISTLTAVGDDDQSIYAFRAALGYGGMDQFAKELRATRVVLSTNYRCNEEILSPAARLINNNVHRIRKALLAARGPGGSASTVKLHDATAEAEAVRKYAQSVLAGTATDSGAVMAVLARRNLDLDEVESAFRMAEVPFTRTSGRSLFNHPETVVFAELISHACGSAKAKSLDQVLSWVGVDHEDLNALHSAIGGDLRAMKQKDLVASGMRAAGAKTARDLIDMIGAWRALVQEGGREILVLNGIESYLQMHAKKDGEKKRLELLHRCLVAFDKTPLGSRIRKMQENNRNTTPDEPHVVLMTAHGSKGLEWNHVWMVRCNEGVFPPDEAAMEEERRLFYVAMTRARDALVISTTTDGKAPSRFIGESGVPERCAEALPSV